MLNAHCAVGLNGQLGVTRRAVGDERPDNKNERCAESQGDPGASNVSPDLPSIHYTEPANFCLLVSAKNMISPAPARKNADVRPSAEPMPTLGSVAT